MDYMNIVSLDILITVDLYLGKAKVLHKNLSIVLSGLSMVILFGDFFNFSYIRKIFIKHAIQFA